MPKPILDVVEDVKAALPLTEQFTVYSDPDTDAIIVTNQDLGFAITRKTIDDGMAVIAAQATFPKLLQCLRDLQAVRDGLVEGDPLFMERLGFEKR